MSDGTTYYVRVVVRDNAGNEGKSAADNANGATAITPSANTNPWFTTQAYASSRSTNTMTISAVATDNEQTSLTYTLYWNGSSNATQTETGNKGTTVTFNAISGLSEYTTYSWRVVVSDGEGGTATSSDTMRTYCSGKNLICNSGTLSNCVTCNGKGIWCAVCGKTYQLKSKGTVRVIKCPICGQERENAIDWLDDAGHWISTSSYSSSGSTRCPNAVKGTDGPSYCTALGSLGEWCEVCNHTGVIMKCTHGVKCGLSHCSHGFTIQH